MITVITQENRYIVFAEDDGRTHKVAVPDSIIQRFIYDACVAKLPEHQATVGDKE